MLKSIAARVGQTIIVIIGVAMLIFFLLRIVPGNAVATMMSEHADAATIARPNRLPARILRAVLAVILAVFCIVAFWFTAVLMQPTVLETPASQIETTAE